MPRGRRELAALHKINVRVYEDDLKMLKQYYPTAGYNQIVRALVNKHTRKLRARTEEILSESELTGLEQPGQSEPSQPDGSSSGSNVDGQIEVNPGETAL